MKKGYSEPDWNDIFPRPALTFREEDQKIILVAPRTSNRFMVRLLGYLNRKNEKWIHLDKFGSFVWKSMLKGNSVEEILHEMEAHFPEEPQIQERTMLFIQMLVKEKYIQLFQKHVQEN